MQFRWKLSGVGGLLALVASLYAGNASATLLADTQLVNSATVSYSDATGTATYQDSDTVTVIVAETYAYVWENYSAGYDENGGTTVATAANTTADIYADLYNRGNVADTGLDITTFAVIYDTVLTGGVAGTDLTIEYCQGDGTIDTTGTVGDDLTCGNDATTPHTSFAFSISACTDDVNVAGGADTNKIRFAFNEDINGGIVVGDLATYDTSGTGVAFEVAEVDDTDDEITLHAPALTCAGISATLVTEVQRYVIVGDLPYFDQTANVPDGTDSSVSWSLVATDGGATDTYGTADDGGTADDRTGTNFAVAILGPNITLTKHTMIVDDTGTILTTGTGLTLTSCETTNTSYASTDVGTLTTGTQTWYSSTDATPCEVDGLPSDGSIYYWLQVNNAGGSTTSTGNNCVVDPDPNGDATWNAASSDTCAGDAYEVTVADVYDTLTDLDTTGADAPLIDSDCNGSTDANDSAANCSTATNQICESPAGTLNFYLGTGASEADAAPGGTVAKSASTAVTDSVCAVYHVTLQ